MIKRTLALAAALGLTVACSQKAPAEAALKAAESAMDAARAEATKLVPDQTKAVQAALDAAKASFDKGDYKATIAAAQEIPAKVADLQTAAMAKKDELTKTWTEMSGSLPAMVEQVKAKLDELGKAKRLPKDMDKEKLATAQADFESVTKAWEEASAASGAGDVADAVAKATMAKDKLSGVMGTLGMAMPEAAPEAATPSKM